jgi:3-isopropylmalate dehydrogenase
VTLRRTQRIAVIGGDGIGPEVTRAASELLEWYRAEQGLEIELWPLDLGAERYLRDGTTLPPDVAASIARDCSAVFLGALGDPRVPDHEHAKQILFGLRMGFDLYANIRPVRALSDRVVPLRGRRRSDVDFVIFRENTEGIYAGIGGQLRRGTADEIAINEDINTRKGVERIVRAAFEYAVRSGRDCVHMADKSNAMRHAHELWLRVFREVSAEYPSIEPRHLFVDTLALRLVQAPDEFRVIVTNNLFGDIISDLGAALQGGLGMAPSANVHAVDPTRVALFEPVHGSAPELAGQGRANPFAALLTAGMLLEHLGWPEHQLAIQRAIADAVEEGHVTPDLGGTCTTQEATARVLAMLAAET